MVVLVLRLDLVVVDLLASEDVVAVERPGFGEVGG